MTTDTTVATKEYVVEISFIAMQPVETAVLMLASSPEEAREVVSKLFHRRQDLVIASINEKPKGYRDTGNEGATTMEVTEEAMTNNVVTFPTNKKDMN